MLRKLIRNIIILFVLIFSLAACKNEKKKYDPHENADIDKPAPADTNINIKIQVPEKASFYKIMDNGIRYHVYDYHPNNAYPNIGDVIYLNMKYFHKDSMIFSSDLVPGDFKMMLKKPKYPGSIYTGFLQLHEKDSAEFIIDAIPFFTKTRELVNIPEFIQIGDSLRFFVRLKKIVPESLYLSGLEKEYQEKSKLEDSEIRKYKITHELETEKLANRIERAIHVVGEGEKITDASEVEIHYTALFLNDKVFSDTKEENVAFRFQMSKDQVIPGLEEGLLGIKEGSKLSLIIPFEQAYGHEKKGPVPPYSTLVFRIEVLDVK